MALADIRSCHLERLALTDSVESLVQDLTTTLSRLSTDFGARITRVARLSPGLGEHDGGPDLVARAERLLEERRLRSRHLPSDLFHEPAWDMLLALFVARANGQVMNVKTLVSSASAPATTSQRWIEHLAAQRFVERVTDAADRRRVEVALSDKGLDAMTRYLEQLPC